MQEGGLGVCVTMIVVAVVVFYGVGAGAMHYANAAGASLPPRDKFVFRLVGIGVPVSDAGIQVLTIGSTDDCVFSMSLFVQMRL